MKHLLLTTLMAFAAIAAQAQITFQWGKASWNIENGRVYENIDEFDADPATLTYENPANFNLTFFNIIAISYDVYIDDATEAIPAFSSQQMGTNVALSYDFIEGHDYRIEVNEAVLCQINVATRTTDTLTTNTDKYSISFRINGPEIVNEYNYEASMSLAITDQNTNLTFSEVDLASICADLGINDITEAKFIGLNANGSYNKAFTSPDYGYDYWDGWRDADGSYTNWWGADGQVYRNLLGHQPYPPVYCIKFNETFDAILYFYYESEWKEYDPDDPGSVPVVGGGVKGYAPKRAPETHYNSIIWDWDNGDGTTTQYVRRYRVDPGCDYKANFIFKTAEKAVLIHATMHFVASEYDPDGINALAEKAADGKALIYGINGARKNSLTKGINIVVSPDGQTRKLYVK